MLFSLHGGGGLLLETSQRLKKKLLKSGLNSEGQHANACWGRGVASPSLLTNGIGGQRQTQMELLDNHFRNVVRRDVVNYGEDYVRKVYTARGSFCIPLLIDPENASDISLRPTPDMEAAGKAPATNLVGKPLNGLAQRERCCVVPRSEQGIQLHQILTSRSPERLANGLDSRERRC